MEYFRKSNTARKVVVSNNIKSPCCYRYYRNTHYSKGNFKNINNNKGVERNINNEEYNYQAEGEAAPEEFNDYNQQFEGQNDQDDEEQEMGYPQTARAPEEEQSLLIMKMYPLGFNPYPSDEDEEEEEEEEPYAYDQSVGEVQYNENQTLNTQNYNSANQNFVTPRKKKKNPTSSDEKKSSKVNSSTKGGTEEFEEDEMEDEEEADDEEEMEEDEGERPPCIYNVWVPDCSRARRDFLVCQQIDIARISNKDDFQADLTDKGHYNSIGEFEEFMACLKAAPNRILQGVESKFGIDIDVSDAFFGLNGARLRAYSFQGPDRKTVYSAFTYFRSSWTVDMAINTITDYDVLFKPDEWYYSVILIDKKPKVEKKAESLAGDGPEEALEPSTQEEGENEAGENEETNEEGTGEFDIGTKESNTKTKNTEDDEDDDDDHETTNASNKLYHAQKDDCEMNHNIDSSGCKDLIQSRIESPSYLETLDNVNNENRFSSNSTSKEEHMFKFCLKYMKYPKTKIRKIIGNFLNREADSMTCTISNMAKLVNENNNKLLDTCSISSDSSNYRLHYKMENFLLDDNNNPIPVWLKMNRLRSLDKA